MDVRQQDGGDVRDADAEPPRAGAEASAACSTVRDRRSPTPPASCSTTAGDHARPVPGNSDRNRKCRQLECMMRRAMAPCGGKVSSHYRRPRYICGHHPSNAFRSTMPLTHYVTLGRRVCASARFCLGAMTFGEDWGWGSSVAESEAIIDRFLEPRRQLHRHRQRLHEGPLREDHRRLHRPRRRHARDRVVIATKFFGNLYPGDPNGGGAGRKAIIAACEQSLRRLQTDYIDLYWMHCWDALHADRRDDARARRSRRAGQGPLHRLLRHARVEGGPGADAGAGSAAGRRSSRCRSSTRCSSAPSKAS